MSEFEKVGGRDRLKSSVYDGVQHPITCPIHRDIIRDEEANYVLKGKSRFIRFGLCDQGYDDEVIK